MKIMLCSDLMRMEVDAISAEMAAEVAARRMRDELVGFLVVCDPESHVLGIVTDRDIAVRVCAENRPTSTPIAEFMSRDVLACRPEDSLARAEDQMVNRRKSRIVVTDAENKLLGVISLTDIAQIEEPLRAARLLREITAREFRSIPKSHRSGQPSTP